MKTKAHHINTVKEKTENKDPWKRYVIFAFVIFCISQSMEFIID